MKKYLYTVVALLAVAFVFSLTTEKASAAFIVDSKTVFDLSCSPAPVFSVSYDLGKNYTGLTALSANTGEAFCPVLIKDKTVLDAFWVESKKQYTSRSTDNGISWTTALKLFDYEKDPAFVAVKKNPAIKNTLVVWADAQQNIFTAFSQDSLSFLAPVQINTLSPAAGKPTIASSGNFVFIAWQDKNSNGLKYVESTDFGRTFSGVKDIGQVLPAHASLSSCVFGNKVICSWTENASGSNRLLYSTKRTDASLWSDDVEITSSTSPISGGGILATTQEACFAAWTSNDALFYSRSVSPSSKWTKPKKILIPSVESESTAITLSQDLLLALCSGKIYDLELETPPKPSSKVPDSFVFDSSRPVISFEAEGRPDFESYLFSIESEKDPSLSSASVFAANSDEFKFASGLADGKYYYRITSGNGIRGVASDIKTFTVDTSPKAAFRFIKPDSSMWFKAGSSIVVEALLNDSKIDIGNETEAIASLNGKEIFSSLSYDKNEKKIFGIINIPDTEARNGENDLEIRILTSSSSLAKSRCKLNIDLNAPSVSFSAPENAVYSASGEKIRIEIIDTASGADTKNSSAKMFTGSSTIEGYCQSGSSLAEMTFIPRAPLSDGIYTMEITPKDLAGNTGNKVKINVIVDSVRPIITLSGELPLTSEKSSLVISGKVDKQDINKVTLSMNAKTLKDIPLNSGNFSAGLSLEKGLNKITIMAQDKAGNTASINRTINCTAASTGAFFEFDGKRICDNDFVSDTPLVKITNSSGAAFAGSIAKLDSSKVHYNDVTGDVTLAPLTAGKHELLLDTYKITFTVEKSVSVNSVVPCPNPFNPGAGSTKITYNLSVPSSIKLYIFDQTGRLVSKKEVSGVTGYNDNLDWNGTTPSGEPAGNGTYLIKLIASSSAGGSSYAGSRLILLR